MAFVDQIEHIPVSVYLSFVPVFRLDPLPHQLVQEDERTDDGRHRLEVAQDRDRLRAEPSERREVQVAANPRVHDAQHEDPRPRRRVDDEGEAPGGDEEQSGHCEARRKLDKRAREPLRLEAFLDEPLLALEHGADTEVAELFSRSGLSPRVELSTWDDYAIMAMVEKGLGLAILPSLILQRIPYRIESRPLAPRAERRLMFAVKAEVEPPLAVSRFRAYLGLTGVKRLGKLAR